MERLKEPFAAALRLNQAQREELGLIEQVCSRAVLVRACL